MSFIRMSKVWPALLVVAMLLSPACSKDGGGFFNDDNGNGDENGNGNGNGNGDDPIAYAFIALHLDEDKNDPPYFSLMNIEDGEPVFTFLSEKYPYRYDRTSWKQYLHPKNGLLGYTLHEDLSDEVEGWTRWTGVWKDLQTGETHDLPILNPCTDFGYNTGCNRFSFTYRNSVRIGACGHIFYVAGSQYAAATWHEEYRYRLVKYDPQTSDYEVSPLISEWTLSQPEINPETYGLASISDNIFPSDCGRYVYGRTSAWGISGGNLIASKGIMFRYDFDDEIYTRVDEVDYGFSPRYATADNNYLLYYNDADRVSKKYNMNTGAVTEVHNASVDGNAHICGITNQGTIGNGSAYPLREVWYHNVIADEIIKISVPDHTRGHVLSKDLSYFYFRYRFSETNYLLRASDLSENPDIDTLAILPENVRVMGVR